MNHDAPAATVSGGALGKRARRALLVLRIRLTRVWSGVLAVTLHADARQGHPVAARRPRLDRAALPAHDTLIKQGRASWLS